MPSVTKLGQEFDAIVCCPGAWPQFAEHLQCSDAWAEARSLDEFEERAPGVIAKWLAKNPSLPNDGWGKLVEIATAFKSTHSQRPNGRRPPCADTTEEFARSDGSYAGSDQPLHHLRAAAAHLSHEATPTIAYPRSIDVPETKTPPCSPVFDDYRTGREQAGHRGNHGGSDFPPGVRVTLPPEESDHQPGKRSSEPPAPQPAGVLKSSSRVSSPADAHHRHTPPRTVAIRQQQDDGGALVTSDEVPHGHSPLLIPNFEYLQTQAGMGDLIGFLKHKEKQRCELLSANRNLSADNERLRRRVGELEGGIAQAVDVLDQRTQMLSMIFDLHRLQEAHRTQLAVLKRDVSSGPIPKKVELLQSVQDCLDSTGCILDGSKWLMNNMFSEAEKLHIGATSAVRSKTPVDGGTTTRSFSPRPDSAARKPAKRGGGGAPSVRRTSSLVQSPSVPRIPIRPSRSSTPPRAQKGSFSARSPAFSSPHSARSSPAVHKASPRRKPATRADPLQ